MTSHFCLTKPPQNGRHMCIIPFVNNSLETKIKGRMGMEKESLRETTLLTLLLH